MTAPLHPEWPETWLENHCDPYQPCATCNHMALVVAGLRSRGTGHGGDDSVEAYELGEQGHRFLG